MAAVPLRPPKDNNAMSESAERPWGSWHVLDEGPGYKVKRIEVNPHSRLSYQTHEHRSEHWVIVSGKAGTVPVIRTGPSRVPRRVRICT